ncbi:unnamed protein product [Caenorhabditis brenneri]
MERPIQLIDMPEDSMRHILERCDFVTLQCLRKTCHTLRNFIDETKPEQSMKVLKVIGSLNRVCLTTCKDDDDDDELYPNGSRIKLYYEQLSSEQTIITWSRSDGKREKTINKGDILNVFSEDLLTVLGCKQPKWDKIHVNCEEEVLEKVKDIFLSRESPFKVQTLEIDSDLCKKQVLLILSSVCPDTLTCLNLDSYQRWNISKMKKLEQWKRVKELHMEIFAVRADINNYSHFDFAKVYFTRVKVKDLLKIKEIFLNTSSIIKYLEMQANRFPHPDCLERIFGDCYLIDMETDEIRCWFFKRADNYVLQFKFAEDMDTFIINIIPMEAVPEDAFISSS